VPKPSAREAALRHAQHFAQVLARQGSANEAHAPDADWPNIRSGQAWAAAHAAEDDGAAKLCIDYTRAAPRLLEIRLPPAILLVWLDHALRAARKLGRRGEEGATYGNLAIASGNLGDFRLSIEHSRQYLTIARETNDAPAETRALNNLATAYRVIGEYARAKSFYVQCLRTDAGRSNDSLRTVAFLGLSSLAYDTRNWFMSLYYAIRALHAARRAGDQRSRARGLTNIGNFCSLWGLASVAIFFHRRALAIFRAVGDRSGEATALGNLGNSERSRGRWDRARELHENDLLIAREIGDRRVEGYALFNLSEAQYRLGMRAQALETLHQSIAVLSRVGSPLAENARARLAAWSD
jgi:tetratricopeptide (TPR) repeat protein